MTRPDLYDLNATSVEILNVIRENATANYKEHVVEMVDGNSELLRTIGATIMQYESLQNEFLSALVNRIGRVLITNKMYSNPWEFFKKGTLEYGEVVEEIFVNIAKPKQYDANGDGSTLFKREISDVRAAFHILNYQKYYKATVKEPELRQAFLSMDGVTNLITKIIDSMYNGASYDEFITMKYLLANHILNGKMYAVNVPDPTVTDNMKKVISKIKAISNKFTFLSDKYNLTGVYNKSDKSEQYIIVNSDFDAEMDVEVLAAAFNIDKAEFSGKRVLVDGFGDLDVDRLKELFGDDIAIPSDAQIEALNKIPAVLVDENWFMILDNLFKFTEQYNGADLYWNYFYHTWKIVSVSPYANNAIFVPEVIGVTSVTVTPATANMSENSQLGLGVEVVTTGFAPKSVTWTSSNENVVVDAYGVVTVLEGATGSATITATSTYDDTKKDTCVVTIV